MVILGIDIGTSACKVAAFTREGEVVACASEAYQVYYPQSGWAEQNPLEWYEAICSATRQVTRVVGANEIKAVGLGGQGWSCIPVDKEGSVLANTPIWFDTRAEQECKDLIEKIGEDEIFSLCKNPVKPSYTTPKVLWFQKNGVYKRTYRFLQSNGYIALRLTGEYTQDKSNGYAHFFYDMEQCRYNGHMAEKMGIDLDKFPPLCNSHQVIGEITRRAAAETGLALGTPVVAGGLDAACGTLGAGVYRPGQTQEQGGQAGGMSIALGSAISHKKLILSNHVVPDIWLLQGGTVGGGGALKWFAANFGASLAKENIFENIDKAASQIAPGSEGVIFMPYMNGERSPIWKENIKGAFYGLDYSKTTAHMARAVLEGVAFSLLHNINTAKQVGIDIDEMFAMGGSANSLLWTQIKADITAIPISVPGAEHATAQGAAIMAGIGTGAYKSAQQAVEMVVPMGRRHEPNRKNHEIYKNVYEKYLKMSAFLEEMN